MIEGIVENIEVGEAVKGKEKTKAVIVLTVSGTAHNGYIEANKDGAYIPMAKDGTVIAKEMVVQFSENKFGEKVFINIDSIVIIPKGDKVEGSVKVDTESKPSLPKELYAPQPVNALSSFQQIRAHAIQAAAMMISSVKGATVKKETAAELADYFVRYIIAGKIDTNK